jgi:hypothetical protein
LLFGKKKRNQSGVKTPQAKGKTRAASKHRTPKEDGVDDMRLHLIERLCRLPPERLADVEALFASLEEKPVDTATPKEYHHQARFPLAPHKDRSHAPFQEGKTTAKAWQHDRARGLARISPRIGIFTQAPSRFTAGIDPLQHARATNP